jgi:hypothetical protein
MPQLGLVTVPNVARIPALESIMPGSRTEGDIVGKQSRNVLAFVSVLTAIGVFTCADATAVTFEDIAGKWCTTGGSEQFDRKNLIAIPSSSHERRVYPIVRYDFTDTMVTVVWKTKDNENVSTDFAEFSADNRRMVQLKNDAGPRREFRRC